MSCILQVDVMRVNVLEHEVLVLSITLPGRPCESGETHFISILERSVYAQMCCHTVAQGGSVPFCACTMRIGCTLLLSCMHNAHWLHVVDNAVSPLQWAAPPPPLQPGCLLL
jgi:hypothetical protein